MEIPVVAVLDANVLHAILVCDCLLWAGIEGLVRPHWTDAIHEEWIRSLLGRRPDLTRAALERRRQAMEAAFPGARVTGYERHVADLRLPDPEDRHILAAAMEAVAPYIVTFNRKDFPAEVCQAHGIEAIHPDDLLAGLHEEAPDRVVRAVRQQRAQLKRRPMSADALVATFRRLGLEGFAAALEAESREI